jgi:hypothetical protein
MELTLSDINELMETRRTRGEYRPALLKHAASGDLAADFSILFPGKKAASLRNSINQNIDKLPEGTAKLTTLLAGDEDNQHVLVINLDTYAAQQAAQSDED